MTPDISGAVANLGGGLIPDLERHGQVNYDFLIKNYPLPDVAEKLVEWSYGESDIMRRDTLDRFLDFIYFRTRTGSAEVINMAYPSRRMNDRDLEKKVIELINVHLYPEIVLKLLKFFARNLYDPDSNLYLARLIESEDIVRSIYETYNQFRKDIFVKDPDRRCLNVKRIQQFSPRSDRKLSSPLDAAARLKYVLEYLAIIRKTESIYTKQDLMLSRLI